MKRKGILDLISENKFIQILLSIILGFIVGAGFLTIMGLSVGDAYGRLLNSVTSVKGFSRGLEVLIVSSSLYL